MKLPLPRDTQAVLTKERILKASNLGLLFNKYVYSWQYGWQMEEKNSKEFREAVSKITFTKDHVVAICNRQKSIIQGLKCSGYHIDSFEATTDSRLIIGLGGTSVIETGMTLHPLYGFPHLPGSGLKGLARAYAEIAEDFPDDETKRDLMLNIFGSEDKDPHNVANNRQGKVFFMDGLPTAFPKLELDIMNPHYGDYYRGEKPPADYLNPVPVTFLAVKAEQKFSFAIYSRDKDLLEKAKEWLIGGLTQLGAGGKTNVGYGYFKDVQSIIISSNKTEDTDDKKGVLPDQSQTSKDDTLAIRLKTVKNAQTFIEFIKSIKDDEIEALKNISFKGMESVINIGLAIDLESAEVSAEFKKIIAQKMLEIIAPNKKWDEKKHEKYKILLSIAGKS